jgi:hypothetical protein
MYVNVDVDVDVDELLGNLDDDKLIEELERRRNEYNTKDIDSDFAREKLEKIWLLRREGKDYDAAVGDLIYYVLGKVI